MATYVLIPGAGGQAWYWHRLAPTLRQLGHAVVTPDLPAADDSAGFDEYADTVIQAIGDRRELVVVAQSLAGFTAPRVCERVPVELLVLLNAMVPAPGESAGDWWTNTGHAQARAEQAARNGRPPGAEFDLMYDFFNDVPPDVIAEAMAMGEPAQSTTPFGSPPTLISWPDVPIRFLQGRDDHFFPLEFQRRVVQERLRITLDEMPGGHLLALSQPDALAERLEAYRLQLRPLASPSTRRTPSS